MESGIGRAEEAGESAGGRVMTRLLLSPQKENKSLIRTSRATAPGPSPLQQETIRPATAIRLEYPGRCCIHGRRNSS